MFLTYNERYIPSTTYIEKQNKANECERGMENE